ncbi:MAG: response regulator [Clostridia bacterium]
MDKKILICDDAAFMRMMFKDIMKRIGYSEVYEAENGKKAIEKYIEFKPDLVFMDITMPEMDGIEALKKIIANDKDAVVVMCAALGQKDLAAEAMKHGAKDVIFKPYNNERVKEIINNVFEKSK